LVVHEVGHYWVERTAGQALWAEFLSVSGWRHAAAPGVGESASTNVGGLSADDWVFAAGSAFARDYGREDPYEDWATTWEAVYQQDTGDRTLTDPERLARKLELVRRFFASVG
jgi:hypothetical protein